MPIATSSKRAAILAIAGRTFLRHGYANASMDGIVAEAGGSKSTLYRYFPSKAALFAAFVEEVGTVTRAAFATVDVEGKDAKAVLEETARAYLDLISTPSALAMTRLVMAEAGRFPEVGRIFYEHGIQRTERQIAAILKRLAERGDVPDRSGLARPGAAAQFRALCEAGPHEGCVWGLRETVSQEEIAKIAHQAATHFLRGWTGQA
ncbi:TetR/AcrR family transcriptional regulator [Azospirillum humicireducens]|nr:TetR/AcrR family transcriptional regulator [Azospirillum humicireducens]